MLNVKKFTDSDYETYDGIVDYVNNIYKKKDGTYYKFEYNNKLMFLYKVDNEYSVFFYNESIQQLDVAIFSYEEENNRAYIDLGEYIWYITKDNQVLVDSNEIIHSMKIVKGKEDYSGYVHYSQYDPKSDVNVSLYYDHHYMAKKGEKQRIYDMNINNPSKVAIRTKASKKGLKPYMPSNSMLYARVDYRDDVDGFFYNLARGNSNSKYYRIVLCTKEGHLVYLPILTTGYTKEEMMDIVKSYGFRTDVPKELLWICNGDIIDVSYFVDLANETIDLVKEGDINDKTIKM